MSDKYSFKLSATDEDYVQVTQEKLKEKDSYFIKIYRFHQPYSLLSDFKMLDEKGETIQLLGEE